MKKTFAVNPRGTSLTKVTAGRGKFTAVWPKQASQTTGYQIQYSTNKAFKSGNVTKTVGNNKTTSLKVTNLKAKTTYYVHVRTYKKAGGKIFYSSWSAAKSVKTK